jgi:uncharacterized protein
MAGPALAHKIDLDHVDLEALDAFLKSQRSAPGSMNLSELDGFLTAIAVGPEMILPSEWLSRVWCGEGPDLDDMEEAKAILGSVMGRYNEILRAVADEAPDPIFWVHKDGTTIPFDWAQGFLSGIALRPDAWEPLFASGSDDALLLPILGLCSDDNDESLIDLTPQAEDAIFDQAPDLIPACVTGIAAFWRRKANSKQTLMSLGSASACEPVRAASKCGRNDPCPCGSGKKFKKCCGAAGR